MFGLEKWIDIIKTANGTSVVVDTCHTIDHGWESMVFKCDDNGNITDGYALDAKWYDSNGEAYEGHLNMIRKWENKGKLD